MPFWRRNKTDTPQEPAVRWLSESESPFGIAVLDCRPLTQNLTAFTESEDIAARFVELRTWHGGELREQQFPTGIAVPDGLRYPSHGLAQRDGPVFKATTMEEKWDIYQHAGRLYFARSWTGAPRYAAQLSWQPGEWAITQAWQTDAVQDDLEWSIRELDYLIKSHVFDLAAPHPLRVNLRGDDQALALASFADFGRRALYGTFDDVIHSAALERSLWE